MSTLIGSVVERVPSAAPAAPNPSKTGFPPALHRSHNTKISAFARARQDEKRNQRTDRTPEVIPSSKGKEKAEENVLQDDQGWQEANMRRVDAMSPEEREKERGELVEQFGGDLLRRVREARERRARAAASSQDSDDRPDNSYQGLSSIPLCV